MDCRRGSTFIGGSGGSTSDGSQLWCSSELGNGWVSFTKEQGTRQCSRLRRGGDGLLGLRWPSYGEAGEQRSGDWRGLSLASLGEVSETAEGTFTGSHDKAFIGERGHKYLVRLAARGGARGRWLVRALACGQASNTWVFASARAQTFICRPKHASLG